MAVQGKLVPQDPNDEPASVLLERIRAEKERLIKEKKIKKEKNPSVIFRSTDNSPYTFLEKNGDEIRDISDEIPFDIPESWEWCRLNDVVVKEVKRGKSPSYADTGSVLVFAQKCNVKTGGINLSLAKYLDDTVIGKYHQEEYMQDRDIIVNSTGTGTLGRIGIYSDEDNASNFPLVPDSHVTIVRADKELSQYLYYILKYYQPFLEESGEGSTKQKELKPDKIKELYVPLPPLAEQHRIVAKIEELLPHIENYTEVETKLNALNTTFPTQLKKSILQQAVQGKLVPQNPDDEPASVLLERIRAEKQELIKAVKIKKDKNESVIFRRDNSHYEMVNGVERCIDDEIPFEVPENWCWCKIGTIFDLQAGKNIQASEISDYNSDHIYPCYGGNGIRGYVETYNRDGDYPLIGRQGALCGNINRATGRFYATEHAVAVTCFAQTDISWACLFLNALNLNQYATATAQPGLAVANIVNVLIPLPPLSEQHRIVEKIEEIMPFITTL